VSHDRREGIRFICSPDGRLQETTAAKQRAGFSSTDSTAVARLLVVPAGAPVFEGKSAVQNVVLLAALAGGQCDRTTAVHWLRQVEVADDLHGSPASSLPMLNRLGIWLAIVQVIRPGMTVFESPFEALDSDASATFARLLGELSKSTGGIVVTGSDPAHATILSASLVSG